MALASTPQAALRARLPRDDKEAAGRHALNGKSSKARADLSLGTLYCRMIVLPVQAYIHARRVIQRIVCVIVMQFGPDVGRPSVAVVVGQRRVNRRVKRVRCVRAPTHGRAYRRCMIDHDAPC